MQISTSISGSVRPLRLFIFGDIDVLISTAWPVLALVYLGMPNTNGVVALIGRISSKDAPIVRRIKEAGAIPVGVSTIPELSMSKVPASHMWWERSSHVYGRTNNAYDQRRIAGGSSGELTLICNDDNDNIGCLERM